MPTQAGNLSGIRPLAKAGCNLACVSGCLSMPESSVSAYAHELLQPHWPAHAGACQPIAWNQLPSSSCPEHKHAEEKPQPALKQNVRRWQPRLHLA